MTMDQLDMLLCALPSKETFLWGRQGERVHPDDMPDVFYDFCKGRAEELKAQILAPRGAERATQAPAASPSHPGWQGPCVLGELYGGSHMPEVFQLFEAMTPEGRLVVIQRKQLCQFCFRHPDTQPCPSHSLPACPIRGCMHMLHRMLHRAVIREEARPIVVGVEKELEERGGEQDHYVTHSEGLTPLNSDKSEGEKPEKPRLCQQMAPVKANGVMHSLHTLYDWGSTVTLVRKESARRMGLWPVQAAQRFVKGFEGSTVFVTGCHFLPLVDARGNHQVICAYEVEEITSMVRTRLPSWTREIFPSVRAHMPWGGAAHRTGQHAVVANTSRRLP